MHNTHQYGSITFYACFTPKPVILSRPPWYPKQTGLIPMIPVIFPVFESYIPVIKEIALFWSVHGFWRSSNWSFKEVWNQNDLFDLMNDPFCFHNYRRVIHVLSHRLLLLLFLVHNYDPHLFITSLSGRHIWCSEIFHGREGVGHDESSSPVGRCLIRNRPWLWLTDKVIITPWIIRHHLPVGYFLRFDEFFGLLWLHT